MVFFVEIVIKLLVLKKSFFQNLYHKSDLIVFICNAIAIIFSLILDLNLYNKSNYDIIEFLKLTKILRLIKIFSIWKTLE